MWRRRRRIGSCLPRVPVRTSSMRRAGELDVVGVHEREDAALGVPADRVAEDARAGRARVPGAVRLEDRHDVGRHLEQRREPGLVVAELLLDLALLGDVGHERDDAFVAAVHARDRRRAAPGPDVVTVAVPEPDLVPLRDRVARARSRTIVARPRRGSSSSMNSNTERADHLLGRDPEHLGHPPVDERGVRARSSTVQTPSSAVSTMRR